MVFARDREREREAARFIEPLREPAFFEPAFFGRPTFRGRPGLRLAGEREREAVRLVEPFFEPLREPARFEPVFFDPLRDAGLANARDDIFIINYFYFFYFF
jgi:hypothetical protein